MAYDAAMFAEEILEILDPEPHGAALNMALDEVLLRRATQPTLRIYRWARASVSFGYFEKVEEVRSVWGGRELVRRWTGGGVVPHGEDFTYSVFAPAGSEIERLAPMDCYRVIHACIGRMLFARGIAVSVAPTAAQKISAACFENPARFDLLGTDGKIAGAAQRRTRWGLLHQGSIQGITLPADFAARFAEGLASRVKRRPVSSEEFADAEDLAAHKYATVAWMEKR